MNQKLPWLQVEQLETRFTPSCLISGTTTLTITGDGGDNDLFILDDGDAEISVHCDGVDTTHSDVSRVIVRTGDGYDVVDYWLTDPLTTPRSLLLDLGTLDDDAELTFSDGVSIDATMSVTMRGGPGSDLISASVGFVNARATFTLDGQAGEDFIDLSFDADLTGVVTVNLRGGDGPDELCLCSPAVVGFEVFDSARVIATLDGGPGDDIISTALEEIVLDTRVTLRLIGGAGNDDILAFASLSDFSSTERAYTLFISGGAGNDRLAVVLNDPAELGHRITVDGGVGTDALYTGSEFESGLEQVTIRGVEDTLDNWFV